MHTVEVEVLYHLAERKFANDFLFSGRRFLTCVEIRVHMILEKGTNATQTVTVEELYHLTER